MNINFGSWCIIILMVKIRLFWPGKTRTPFIAEGVKEYLKFLKNDACVEIIEFREGHGDINQVIKQESEKFLEKLPENFVLLDERGENLSSIDFASFLKNKGEISFAVGGVYGPSPEVKKRAFLKMALSKMTLTHEMARLVLLEQLYRAFAINKGKKYHY